MGVGRVSIYIFGFDTTNLPSAIVHSKDEDGGSDDAVLVFLSVEVGSGPLAGHRYIVGDKVTNYLRGGHRMILDYRGLLRPALVIVKRLLLNLGDGVVL